MAVNEGKTPQHAKPEKGILRDQPNCKNIC